MSGQPETVAATEDGSVIGVARGDKGEALINITASPREISLPTGLPDGEYSDKVYGEKFVVADGVVTGRMMPLTSYILEK